MYRVKRGDVLCRLAAGGRVRFEKRDRLIHRLTTAIACLVVLVLGAPDPRRAEAQLPPSQPPILNPGLTDPIWKSPLRLPPTGCPPSPAKRSPIAGAVGSGTASRQSRIFEAPFPPIQQPPPTTFDTVVLPGGHYSYKRYASQASSDPVWMQVRDNWSRAEQIGMRIGVEVSSLRSDWIALEQRRLTLQQMAYDLDQRWAKVDIAGRLARYASAHPKGREGTDAAWTALEHDAHAFSNVAGVFLERRAAWRNDLVNFNARAVSSADGARKRQWVSIHIQKLDESGVDTHLIKARENDVTRPRAIEMAERVRKAAWGRYAPAQHFQEAFDGVTAFLWKHSQHVGFTSFANPDWRFRSHCVDYRIDVEMNGRFPFAGS
jgi:hypothetical protein